MRLFKIYLTVLVLCLVSGCEHFHHLDAEKTQYSASAQTIIHREILLNIVRLRYSEPPFFVVHNSVPNRVYALSKSLNFLKRMLTSDSKNLMEIENYPGLNRVDFSKQFMTPVDLEILEKLVNHGWDIGQIFRLFVKKIGNHINVDSRSGPIPTQTPEYKDFFILASLLQDAHMRRQVEVKVLSSEKEKIESEGGGENVSIQTNEKILQLCLPPNTEETDRLADFLKINKKRRTNYQFNLPHNEQSGIFTRSLLECMYYLSFGVQIPPDELKSKALIVTYDDAGLPFNWKQVVGDLITIQWSKTYPKNAFVSIYHHGYWFYIDNADLASKNTFSLLQQVYLHQVM